VPLRTTVPGRIEFNANKVTPLFAHLPGRVVRLDVEVGTPVAEGQTIAMLDSPDVVGMQADYREALAARRAARTSRNHAGRTRERAARLATVEAIPVRELQDAQLAETRAAEDLQQAEARLAAARGRLQIAGFADDQIDRVETGGASSLMRLVPLTAPVAGTIVERHVGLGQAVQAGGDALLNIRGIGLFAGAEDIGNVMVTSRSGTPLYIRQLGDVNIGDKVRLGKVGHDDRSDVVTGIVYMRRGEQTRPTLERVAAKVNEISAFTRCSASRTWSSASTGSARPAMASSPTT